MDITPAQQVDILRAACCVAAADGDVCQDELVELKKMADALGVGQASMQAMIDRALSDPSFFERQFDILKSEPLACLDVLLGICKTNGVLKKSEFQILTGLAIQLEISPTVFAEHVKASVGDLSG